MSHLTRYPNQFYQPTPARRELPEPEIAEADLKVSIIYSPDPPVAAPREKRARPSSTIGVPVEGWSVLGLDR